MDDQKTILSAEGICAIIKACGETKVVRMRLGDLYLQFDQTVAPLAPSAPLPPASLEVNQDTEAKESLLRDELAVREDQVRQMLIEDPVAAEKLFMEGELVDDGEAEEA